MKRKRPTFYYIILMLFLQVFPCSFAMAITGDQEEAIVSHCETIRESLKSVQRADAKARIHLGGYYEIILTRFIVPLNIRLVENNLTTAALVENQNAFAEMRVTFANDFTNYQQVLEELVAMDCKNRPEEFYQQLITVRQRRKMMAQDVLRMRSLISEHVKLVSELRSQL